MRTTSKQAINTFAFAVVLTMALAILAVITAAPVGAAQSTEHDRNDRQAPGAIQAQEDQTTTPGQPRNVVVSTTPLQSDDVTLSWDAPASNGGSEVTSYVVQWKSGDEVYDETRQVEVTARTHTFTDLTHGTGFTFRVSAKNQNGTGTPSAETIHLHKTNLGKLTDYTREHIVEAYEADHPWLRLAWDHLTATDDRLVIEYGNQGSRMRGRCSDREDGLFKCYLIEVLIIPGHVEDPFTIVHEMAHVYTLVNGLDTNPAPAGMGHIYFRQLADSDVVSEECDLGYESYADMLATAVTGLDSDGYWPRCNPDFLPNQGDALSQSALAVAEDVSANRTPDWFDDVTLEEAWDIMLTMKYQRYDATVFMLRNQFGGYCDVDSMGRAITAEPRTPITNPWQDSGCTASMPQNFQVIAGDQELTVSWDEPESIGGATLDNYRIQWASGDQSYNSQRLRVVSDLNSTSHRFTSLANNVEHRVRVAYVNHFGTGAYAEVTATPAPNHPATGTPSVSGTSLVGQVLTVDTSTITDADGTENASFAYQWFRNDGTDDSEIEGANGVSYQLTDGDVAHTVSVKVFFTDDRGFDETLTSAATSAVSAGLWSGTMTVGASGDLLGYSFVGPVGRLTDREFSVGESEHTVFVVLHDATTMYLRVYPGTGTNMSLHIGGVEFDLADATESSSTPGLFQWLKGSTNWSEGDTVHLSLGAND